MEQSPLRLIKHFAEYISEGDIDNLLREIRGIYVLYDNSQGNEIFDVVYVGMSRSGHRGGIRSRLRRHRKKKEGLWTHCSVFEVWDNIRDDEVIELEGLFRHIYRLDSRANELNLQKGFRKLRQVEVKDVKGWNN